MMAEVQNVSWPGWETVRLIGRGSFGAVYEIQRNLFGRIEKAALKVISIPQNASDIEELYSDGYDEESITSTFQSYLQNIVTEYSLMREMNGSSNVVNCDDVRYVQHDNGIGWDIFIKMELLTPLTKALPGQIPEETAVKIARDLCAALELCRKHNIVHRDIKPQNIFVSPNGDYKLGDFGVAKTVEKTTGGTKIGTYKYMAPEVYHNRPYGAAADIYSLGLVLYWLLNQRRMPFLPLPPEKLTAGAEEQARYRRLSGEALPAPKNGSAELKRIVLKACAYDPKDRYATAGEMLRDLQSIPLAGTAMPVPPAAEPERAVAAPRKAAPEEDATVGVYWRGNAPAVEEDATVGLYSQVNTPAPEEDATVGVYPQGNTPAAEPKKAAVIPTPPAVEADRQKQAEADEDLTVSLFHKAAPQDKSRAAAEEDTRRKEEQEAQPGLVSAAQEILETGAAEMEEEIEQPHDQKKRNAPDKKKKKVWLILAAVAACVALAAAIGIFLGSSQANRGEIVDTVSAGSTHTVGLKSDGTVVAVGYNGDGQCDVSDWQDIVAISAGGSHTVGLKSDGTVVAVGNNFYGRLTVSAWRDIVAISAGGSHTVGLKSDGTVVAVGTNEHGLCEVSGWRDIVAISTGYGHTVALKSDGTVVAVGNNLHGQCDVSGWRDIVAISAGSFHTVGLKSDGTVVAVGYFEDGQCKVSDWQDIVAISAGGYHTVGVKSDGTVVAVGNNDFGQCEASGWQDIVEISAGDCHTVGIKSDGTVVAVGRNDSGRCDVSDWRSIKASE